MNSRYPLRNQEAGGGRLIFFIRPCSAERGILMKRQWKRRWQPLKRRGQTIDRRGSSVVELLVVTMLLIFLAALSVAGFGRYRSSAQQAQCVNNLRQIGTGLAAYLAEHGGVYPHYNDDYELDDEGSRVKVRTRKWNTLLLQKGYVRDRKTFICRAAGGTAALALVDQGLISYGYNIALSRDIPYNSDWFSPRARVVNVSAEVVVIADAAETGRWDDGFVYGDYILYPYVYKSAGGGVAWPRHNGICNVLWGDGRVTPVRASDPHDYRTLYQPEALGDMYSQPRRWLRQRE